MTGTAAEPKNQHMLASVARIKKKKYWMWKSTRLIREETPSKKGEEEELDQAGYSEAGLSQEQEEAQLINEVVTIPSLSLNELWDMQENFSNCPEKHIVT